MYFILTDFATAYVAANPATPPVLSAARLGSGSNYTPSSSATSLVGAVVYASVPSQPHVQDTDLLRYTITLDGTLGGISFGEVGLYLGSDLFALGTSNTLLTKDLGDSMTIDCFLDTTSTTYSMYAAVSSTMNNLLLPTGGDVDSLVPAHTAGSNVYVCRAPADPAGSVVVSTIDGQWSVAGYFVLNTGTAQSTSSYAVTHDGFDEVTLVPLTYPGRLLVRFTSGPAKGLIRVLSTINHTTNTFTLHTPLSGSFRPEPGDRFTILSESNGLRVDTDPPSQGQLVDAYGANIPAYTQMPTYAQLLLLIAGLTSSGGGSGGSSGEYTDAFGVPISI